MGYSFKKDEGGNLKLEASSQALPRSQGSSRGGLARRAKNSYPGFSRVVSGNRYYSPNLARWISRDPIEEAYRHLFASDEILIKLREVKQHAFQRGLRKLVDKLSFENLPHMEIGRCYLMAANNRPKVCHED